MNVYLIVMESDSVTDPQDYQDLENFVASLNGINLSKTVFAVKTDFESAEEVFELLKIYVINTHHLLIIKTDSHFYGQASPQIIDWLYDHL